MEYVCDAPPYTWFRIMTDAEAGQESKAMDHAVEKYFRQMRERAEASYVPPRTGLYVEQSIGRKDHIRRVMPIFVTLRDREGKVLVTGMLPPGARDDGSFRPIIVGKSNSDPYSDYGDAIKALAGHFSMTLDADRCYPYRR